jgi:flagellar basal-body rod modification protein FlgD
LHDLKKGDNKWTWNGKNEGGTSTPVGEYQMLVEAKGSNGKKLFVKTDFSGIISGLAYTAEGPVLMVGSQSVKLKDVKKIVDPSIKSNDQKTATIPVPDLKSSPPASENEDKGAEEAPPSPGNLMTSVGMSNGMMEKFKKDTTTPAGPRNEPTVMKEETKAAKADSSQNASVNPGKKLALKGALPSANM